MILAMTSRVKEVRWIGLALADPHDSSEPDSAPNVPAPLFTSWYCLASAGAASSGGGARVSDINSTDSASASAIETSDVWTR